MIVRTKMSYYNNAALRGGRRLTRTGRLHGGMRMRDAVSLVGGWDTNANFQDVVGIDFGRVADKILKKKKNLDDGWLSLIAAKIYEYDTAIAEGNRKVLGLIKGHGLQICARHLGVSLQTAAGKKKAETLWNYVRDKIHYGPGETPVDSVSRRLELSNPETPWVGTYYSYPIIRGSTGLKKYLDYPFPEWSLDPNVKK